MGRRCIVPNCLTKNEKKLHKIPTRKTVAQKWIAAIDSPFVNSLTLEEINKKQITVCKNHFEENAYIGGPLKRNLKADAIPTMNVANVVTNHDEVSIDVPHIEIETTQCVELIRSDLTRSMKYMVSPVQSYAPMHNSLSEVRQSSLDYSTVYDSRIDVYDFQKKNCSSSEKIGVNDNLGISATPKKSKPSTFRKRKISLGKPYKVELTPVAKKIYHASVVVRKRLFDTTYRLKRYN